MIRDIIYIKITDCIFMIFNNDLDNFSNIRQTSKEYVPININNLSIDFNFIFECKYDTKKMIEVAKIQSMYLTYIYGLILQLNKR